MECAASTALTPAAVVSSSSSSPSSQPAANALAAELQLSTRPLASPLHPSLTIAQTEEPPRAAKKSHREEKRQLSQGECTKRRGRGKSSQVPMTQY